VTDEERIKADRINRFKFLKFVYDDYRGLPSSQHQMLPAKDVGPEIGLSAEEALKIADFWKGKGLLNYATFGPTVQITPRGIDYVEEALAHPDRPTEFLPPINVMMFAGDVHGAQIQQGVTASSQHMSIGAADRSQLLSEIESAKARLRDIAGSAARDDMEADLDTAAAQLRRSTPNVSVLRESFRTIRSVAEQVGAGLVVEKLLQVARTAGLL
jgi:hypothetical protein